MTRKISILLLSGLFMGLTSCARGPQSVAPSVEKTAIAIPTVEVTPPFPDAPPGTRPQTPQEPFPYTEMELQYKNLEDGTILAATFTRPEGEGPFPGVVLLTGSGAQDRDSSLLGHKPFRVWADHLARRGIAVLRQDDRGVGGSGGLTVDTSMETKAVDAMAALEVLRSQAGVDGDQVGLLGHSEGAMVATRGARLSEEVDFVVWLAGPGMDLGEILVLQKRAFLEAGGADATYVERVDEIMRRMVVAAREEDSQALEPILVELVDLEWSQIPPERGVPPEQKAMVLKGALAMATSVAARTGMQYDPTTDLLSYTRPFLGIWGGKDLQVPAVENSVPVRDALSKARNGKAQLRVYDALNHLLQAAETGLLNEYAVLPESVHPQVLQDVSDWILGLSGP